MKLSDELFEWFKERVFYWKDQLGINHINIIVGKENLEDCNACVISPDRSTGHMTIFIGDPIADELADTYNVDKMAFHEVFEGGYFIEIGRLAAYSWRQDEIDHTVHRSVRCAESTIFEYMKGY